MSWGLELIIIGALLLLVTLYVSKPERPRKKFLKQLHDTKPINPQHAQPITKPHSLLGDDDALFFTDFAEFGDVLNSSLSDERSPWRLQERALRTCRC